MFGLLADRMFCRAWAKSIFRIQQKQAVFDCVLIYISLILIAYYPARLSAANFTHKQTVLFQNIQL
jgi:hypothetical protein